MLPMLPSITIYWTQHGIVHCHWCCIKCKEHSGSQVDGCMHKKLHSFSLHCPATRIVWCQWRSKGMLRDLCQPSNTVAGAFTAWLWCQQRVTNAKSRRSILSVVLITLSVIANMCVILKQACYERYVWSQEYCQSDAHYQMNEWTMLSNLALLWYMPEQAHITWLV